MKYCGYCGHRLGQETVDKPERRKAERTDHPAIIEIRAVFHRLWSSQVGRPDYSKRDWRELRDMLFRRYKVEL